MYCHHCGSIIEDDSVFCGVCGFPQDRDNQREAVSSAELVTNRLCPSCNAKVDSDSVFCSKCGTSLADVSTDSSKPSVSSASCSEAQDGFVSVASNRPAANTSKDMDPVDKTGSSKSLHVNFDSNWSTNYAVTAAGMIIAAALNFGFNALESSVVAVGAFVNIEILSMVYTLGNMYYCFIVYPTFFTPSPLLRSTSVVSLLNGLFGGVLFGCLWNTCLAKHKKGVSYIVSGVGAILATLAAAYNIYLVLML